MESYRSERTVNLKYLCVKLSRFWIWIAAAAAAGAVLLTLWRYLSGLGTYRAQMRAFEQGVKNAAEPVPVKFPFAFIIIGLLIGAFLAALFIFLRTYLSGKLKCAEELDRPKDAQLLAVFRRSEDTKAEKKMKQWVRYPEPGSDDAESVLLYSKLLTTCRNQEIGKIVFAGDAADEDPELFEHIAQKLLEGGIPTEVIGDILRNPEAIVRLNAGDGIVLIAKAGKTTYRTLDQEIAQCVRQNAKLIGFAAFE